MCAPVNVNTQTEMLAVAAQINLDCDGGFDEVAGGPNRPLINADNKCFISTTSVEDSTIGTSFPINVCCCTDDLANAATDCPVS